MTTERRKALFAKFQVIAAERLAKLGRFVLELEQRPDQPELAAEVMREIHTLKGDAKVMGFAQINLLAHRTEDALLWARDRGFALAGEPADALLAGLDLMGLLLKTGVEHASEVPGVEAHLARLDALMASGGAAPLRPAPTPAGASPAAAEPAPAHAEKATLEETAAEQYVRVSTADLTSLTNLSAELLLRQEQFEKLVSDLHRIGDDSGRALLELQRTSRAATSQEVRPGLERLGALAKETRRTLSWARDEFFEHRLQLKDLQERVREMRLRQIGELLERYPRAIRDLAKEQGKKVKVVMEGAEVSVDKQVLDRVDEPLLHLLRNSVDHGLETPEERRAGGKDEQGTLWLRARQRGGEVEIEVRDDGRGIHPEKLRAAAVRKGWMDASQAEALSDEAAVELVFRPGFSTRTEVSDISGRGVGLDVVKRSVEQLGGTVRIDNAPGRGAAFVLTVPVSVALTRALLVQTGAGLFALPSSSVEQATRVPEAAIEPAGTGRALKLDGKRIPLLDLDEVLGKPGARGWEDTEVSVVVVRSGERRLALRVRKLIGERQAAQKVLDPFLAGVRLVTGTAVLEGGRLVLFLNTPELFRDVAVETRSMAREARAVAVRRRVLVVEDSELVRDVVVSLLGRLGFDPLEAVDGADALTKLGQQLPDLILTDLDMPVLDGFGLIARVREMPAAQKIPIVVLSTRGSDADKQRAAQAGADAFVVKSDFQEGELKKTLDRLLTSPT